MISNNRTLALLAPLILFLLVSPLTVLSSPQGLLSADTCMQQDIMDLLRKKGKPPREPRRFSILVLPSVSANPSNGLLIGLSGPIGWRVGNDPNTNVSGANVSLTVTTKKQLISFIKTNIYTKENRFFLQGDWRFYLYSQTTYGLGTNAPDTAIINTGFNWQGIPVSAIDGSYPIRYDYLKVHEIISYQVYPNLYAGLGYHMDYYTDIRDEDLDLTGDTIMMTPHYFYCKEYGFDSSKYMLSGVSLNVVYDTRDNLVNPYSGIFANANFRYNLTMLGSDQNSSSLWLEFRSYIGLSKERPRHLVAFWVFGNFVTGGTVPYLDLFSLGDDQRARSGRGYLQGRYRGAEFVYGEAEYRFPISPCSQILGGVVFVNACSASNQFTGVRLFDYVKPAVGAGLRIMVNKHFRTNINIDFAVGLGSDGLYFSGQEAF